MALGSFNTPGTQMPTAEINMTPLVDVMLVLLIIFIVAAPLLTHAVPVDLPRASSTPTREKPATLQVAIASGGALSIDGQAIAPEALEERLRAAVARHAEVEMQLRADRATRYETVAETLSAARRAGLTRIGFVTLPGESPR